MGMFQFTPDKQVGQNIQRIGQAAQPVMSFEDELRRRQGRQFTPDFAQSNQVRQSQIGLGKTFEDMIAGRGPSVAEQQMRMGQDAAIKAAAAQTGLAASRGGGYGGLARGLAQTTAQTSQDVAGQAALLRAQEQQAAMQNYGGLLSGMRGQDLQGTQLGLQAEQLSAQDQQAKDSIRAQLMGLGLSAAQAEVQAQMQLEQMKLQGEQNKRGFWGGLANKVGSALTFGIL
jgi:hypothetical protein